jgi:FkbM family methyltransferase
MSRRINLVSLVPSPLLAFLRRASLKLPLLARILVAFSERLGKFEGTIQAGPGAGLRINATGGARPLGYMLGEADTEEQNWLSQHLGPGDTFYDVGANIGFLSLIGAKLVGQNGQVVAFEPLPSNITQLRMNAALNGFEHITVIGAAAAAVSGPAVLGLPHASPATRRARAHIVGAATDGERTFDVRALAIDDCRARYRLRPPTVMKIDVEGAEIDVLKGCLRTLKEYRPTILVEVHWLGSRFTEFVAETLLPMGYLVETLHGHNLASDPGRFHAVLRQSPPADDV